MKSYLFNGQWTTDKIERKYRHMSVIPFPVCAIATISYKERRQNALMKYLEGRRLENRKKKWNRKKIK